MVVAVANFQTFYCTFCGQDLVETDGKKNELQCVRCGSVFYAKMRNGCLVLLEVKLCGKECTCFSKDSEGKDAR